MAAVSVAFIATFAVYWQALHAPFVFDDKYLPIFRLGSGAWTVRNCLGGVRPVLMFSFWLNYRLSASDQTLGYHLVNISLHLANAVLVYFLLRRVQKWSLPAASQSKFVPWLGSLVFLLHPLQTEAVSYVAGRSEVLSAFFVLAALVIFMYRRKATISFYSVALILVLFGAACLTKEHALVLLGLLLITDYYWNPGFSVKGFRGNWRLYLPLLGCAFLAVCFVLRTLDASDTAGFRIPNLHWYQYFFTECRVLWKYVGLFLLPIGQNIDHDVPISRTPGDYRVLVGLISLLVFTGLAWRYRKSYPTASYGVFTFLIALLPTSSFIPLRDPIAEHRMYLPLVGLVLVAVGLLPRSRPVGRTMILVIMAGLALVGWLTYRRNVLWGSAVTLWQDSAIKSPHKIRPRFQFAFALFEAGQCREAVTEYQSAGKIAPPSYQLLMDWGLAEDCAGDRAGALTRFKQAAILNQTAHVYSLLGMEYAKGGQYEDAMGALDRAADLDSTFERTFLYRGNVYRRLGNIQKAADEYARALAIDPRDSGARQGLIWINARACVYTTPSLAFFTDSREQMLTIQLAASAPNCDWILKSSSSWLIPSLISGTGSAAIAVKVGANGTGEDRSANLFVGEKVIPITQRASTAAFADVPPSNLFFNAIGALKLRSVPDECADDPSKYCPDTYATRGQMALFLTRAKVGNDSFPFNPTPFFRDVTPNHRYFKWIQKARELALVEGCSPGKFCPDRAPTRAEVAACVLRARPGGTMLPTVSAVPFFDDVPIAHPYFTWIQKARQIGMTSGCGPRRYCPDESTTRGEMAKFMVLGLLNRYLPPGTPLIESIDPAESTAGRSLVVAIVGKNTTFASGLTQVAFMPGEVVASDVHVISAVKLTAKLTISHTATPGPRVVTVTTGLEEATLVDGFRVTPTGTEGLAGTSPGRTPPQLLKRPDAH